MARIKRWFSFTLIVLAGALSLSMVLVSILSPWIITNIDERFDTYLQALDDALREMGVGDLSVGKKMRKLGEAFYGRAKSYETAFGALPDPEPLTALLSRTVYAQTDAEQGVAENAGTLADYVLAQRAAIAEQATESLVAGEAAWRPI